MTQLSSLDFQVFNDSLATLARTGVALPEGLRQAARGAASADFRAAAERLAAGVSAGRRLSDAMAAEPKFFSPAYIAIVCAGEESGKLPEALLLAVRHENIASDFRHRVRGSLIYPAVVFALGIIGYVVLMMFVAPIIFEVYKLAGGRLPASIQALTGLGMFLSRISVLVAVAVVVGWVAYAVGPLKGWLDGLWLRVPLLRDVLVGQLAASFAATVSDALKAGIPLDRAVGLGAAIAPNLKLRAALSSAAARVKEGQSLSEALKAVPGFPALALTSIAAGEGAALPGTLAAVAEYYRDETADKSRRFIMLLDQALIFSAGAWVGLLLVSFFSLYSNMIQLADGLARW